MELKALQKKEVKAGDVAVFRGTTAHEQVESQPPEHPFFYKLAIIVSVSADQIVLSPFTAFWDDDDETVPAGAGLLRIPKSIPTHQLSESLAKPILEIGDNLMHRGRPAHISETRPHDLHVTLKYDDPAGGDFYGNLIWMDLTPTLDLLRDQAAWPALA